MTVLPVAAACVVGLAMLVPALGVAAVALLAIFAPAVPLTVMVTVEAMLRRLLPPRRTEQHHQAVLAAQRAA